MTEYKDTLNLPHTDFPMKASLSQREPQRLASWKQNKLYADIRKARAGAPKFILHDGPPYANGHLHCGHAFNKILKDMILKSKTLSGFDAPFVPGWDCHGLPVELNVEKKVGKVGVKVDARTFRGLCREYASSQIDIQRGEFERLGVLGDWFNPYATMNFSYEANIVRALGLMIKKGHLLQGFKPVHWCIDCGSSLAEAEVEYEDKTSPSIDVAFAAVDASVFLKQVPTTLIKKPVIVPVWTTTPWTLPANEAVCLNAQVDYALVQTEACYFIVAEPLVASFMKRIQQEVYTLEGTVKGAQFEHLLLKHPFYDREVPVILGEHVTIETGTGAVHTAPAHGPDDYWIGLQYNLPLNNPVLGNGCYGPDVPLLAGIPFKKANDAVLDLLKEHQVLLHHAILEHSYPHCWRHKTPVIFRATPQWFISMDQHGLRQSLLEQIDVVDWVPGWGKARIQNMVKDRPDWCVSRQRAWGTPMPLFIHKTKRALHPKTLDLIEVVAKQIEVEGIDAWFELDPKTLLGDDADQYEKISDTLDVWFDSGVSHFCVLKQNQALAFPADVYMEGSDQHRGWFNSSLTTSVAMSDEPPYKAVLTHGFTVDAEGKKLSKSKGNYVALDKLIAEHGADLFRLWAASTDYRNEVSISDDIIKRTGDTYRRIRNTARFLLANLFDFDPKLHAVAPSNMVELDRFIVQQCMNLQDEIIKAYEDYNFHVIYQKIHHFCAVDLGGFYLDIIKDRQYTTLKNSDARRSCQTAMFHVLHALTRWLAPIVSFTAEEIWEFIPGASGESLFTQTWYTGFVDVGLVDMAFWETLVRVRDEVNKTLEVERKAGTVGSSLAADLRLYAKDDLYDQLLRLQDELKFIFITSSVRLHKLSERPATASFNDVLNLAVLATASTHEKCARCWHRCEDVGFDKTHPELCGRCVGHVMGVAEQRSFA
ncbi:MAG: isoleucine--tRNA ligase [Legionellaceae bacterium]